MERNNGNLISSSTQKRGAQWLPSFHIPPHSVQGGVALVDQSIGVTLRFLRQPEIIEVMIASRERMSSRTAA